MVKKTGKRGIRKKKRPFSNLKNGRLIKIKIAVF